MADQSFEGRELSQVLMDELRAVRDDDGTTRFAGRIGIYLKALDGSPEGPHIVARVGVPISLETPFQDIERALLGRAIELMRRFLEETPDSLHQKWIQSSKEVS